MKNRIQLIIALCILSISLQGQILGKVFNRAQDKLADKIADEINDAIYREIEKRVLKSVDDAMDDLLREKYTQDSINGKPEARDYSSFLAAFTADVELPSQYTFDIVLKAKVQDYNKKKSEMEMMLTKDGSLMAMRQFEGNKITTIVMDLENDVFATFNEEEGKKTAVAIPNVFSIGGEYIKANVDEEDMEMTFEKTGKTKKIEGYNCEEWKIEDKETKTKAFIATSFPISWKDSHKQFLRQMMPTVNRDDMPDGMALKSESKTKKKNKKSTFEVIDIDENPASIITSEYEKVNYTEYQD